MIITLFSIVTPCRTPSRAWAPRSFNVASSSSSVSLNSLALRGSHWKSASSRSFLTAAARPMPSRRPSATAWGQSSKERPFSSAVTSSSTPRFSSGYWGRGHAKAVRAGHARTTSSSRYVHALTRIWRSLPMLFLLLPFGLDFQHDLFDLLELIRGADADQRASRVHVFIVLEVHRIDEPVRAGVVQRAFPASSGKR